MSIYTDLAKQLGISLRHAYYVLDGKRRPSAELARELEKITGIVAEAWIFPDKYENPYLKENAPTSE